MRKVVARILVEIEICEACGHRIDQCMCRDDDEPKEPVAPAEPEPDEVVGQCYICGKVCVKGQELGFYWPNENEAIQSPQCVDHTSRRNCRRCTVGVENVYGDNALCAKCYADENTEEAEPITAAELTSFLARIRNAMSAKAYACGRKYGCRWSAICELSANELDEMIGKIESRGLVS